MNRLDRTRPEPKPSKRNRFSSLIGDARRIFDLPQIEPKDGTWFG